MTNNGGTSVRYEPADRRNGLRYEADEVEGCLRTGLLESPVMLDETVSIMETIDAVLARARQRRPAPERARHTLSEPGIP